MNTKTRFLCEASLIAALYVILTLISSIFGLANGVIQIRLSEALTILPFFTAAAIPGLTIGCIISNSITGCLLWDVIAGSAATLLGALASKYLSRSIYTAAIWPVISNVLIIPFILLYVYGIPGSYYYFVLTIFISEFISCFILGTALSKFIKKTKLFL